MSQEGGQWDGEEGEEDKLFRIELLGSLWGLGVTTKSLDKGTERVMVPVEDIRIAEG